MPNDQPEQTPAEIPGTSEPKARRQRQRRGRGEGSVFRRKDGSWCARISVGYRRIDRYEATKRDALKKLLELQNGGWAVRSDRKSVKTYLEEFLEDVRTSREFSTFDSYKRTLANHVIPFIGSTALSKIAAADLRDLYGRLEAGTVPQLEGVEKQKRSARTRQYIHAILNAAFKRALQMDLIPKSPCAGVRCPRYKRPPIQYWTAAQARTFMEAVREHRLEALYALALVLGSRQGELFGLKWTDVDWENGAINISRTANEASGTRYIRDGSKTGRGRRVAVGEWGMAALKRHRERMLAEGQRASEWLFRDTEGNRLRRSNVVRRSFEPMLKSAGLPRITFHALRHTCATALLEAGESIEALAQRLGHATPATTSTIYVHVTSAMQERAAATADRLFGTD